MANAEIRIRHLPAQPGTKSPKVPPFETSPFYADDLGKINDKRITQSLKAFTEPVKEPAQSPEKEIKKPSEIPYKDLPPEEQIRRITDNQRKTGTYPLLTAARPYGDEDRGKPTGIEPIQDIVEKAVDDKNKRTARQKKPKRF